MNTHPFPLRCACAAQPSRQRGFSLVELMVGITVGLVLVAGLSLLFANSSRTGNELEKSIRQMENGRYAIELLHEEIGHAGFFGEVPADALSYSSPNVCATAATDLGWDKSAPTTPVAPMPLIGMTGASAAGQSCIGSTNVKTDSAAFSVHRLDVNAIARGSITTGHYYVQTSRCSSDAVADPFIVGTTSSVFTLRNRKCDAAADAAIPASSTASAIQPHPVRKYISRIYFVAPCNECPGDSTPTLKMADLRGTTMTIVPLVEGIERMAIEYGFDTNNDGSPDVFRTDLSSTADGANVWANVVAARVHVLARTNEPTAGYDDAGKTYVLGAASVAGADLPAGYKRRVYSTTVRLTNVAGRREVPTPAASTPAPS